MFSFFLAYVILLLITLQPDLVRRLKEDIPLAEYDRSTFYVPGDYSGKGYTDFPFAP